MMKKRLALPLDGPKSKRPRISMQVAEKRRLPVTRPIKELEEEEEEEEEEMEMDDEPSKATNVTRESHKAQRIVQEQRKAAKPHSQLITNAKRVWSLARQKNIPSSERQKHVRDLMQIVSGKVKDIALKHDASRIIQTIVKYGGQNERNQVAAELKGQYRELAQNKYSKFLVTKLIRICPAHRVPILLEFQSHVLKLLLHREASTVLADAFELYTNAYERSILLHDFYGKEAALFSTGRGTEQDIEIAKRGLCGIYDGVEDNRRRRLLSALKENLTTIFNNPDKGTITHAIVHRALWEFLVAVGSINEDSEKEKLRREMFETCQDVLAEMVHTKDGSRVVRDFIAHGTAKDRKHIIKVIKPHVERMCIDDEAQLVLFTALDTIDDTKLTIKSLVADITSHASSLASSPQGRRSLFHLIIPRSRKYFTPAQIAMMAETDGARLKTSKKDNTVREAEIRKAASEALLQFVTEKGAETARDTGGSLLVLEIMLYSEGDKSSTMTALAEILASPYPSEDPARPHPIDLPHTSRMYKSLLQGGHFSHSEQSVVRSSAYSPSEFASLFLSVVGKDATLKIAQGNGAFVVAELLERIHEEGSVEQKLEVKDWFDHQFVARLKDSEAKGKDILIKKISSLS